MESIVTECGRLLLFTLMNLTSVDITRILSANAETRNVFLCCAPFYAIPYAKTYPHAIVVNTGAPCRRRAHWCVLYVVSASLVEYFDPRTANSTVYGQIFQRITSSQSGTWKRYVLLCMLRYLLHSYEER